MNDLPISIHKLKTAKTWEQLRTRLDEVLERGEGNKHVDMVIQSVLRQKPPIDFKEYELLSADMGQIIYGYRDIGRISEVAHHAVANTNIAWLTALIKHCPLETLAGFCSNPKKLSNPKFPRTLLYKIQDAIFQHPSQTAERWAGLHRCGKVLDIIWTNHPRVCSRVNPEHMNMISTALSELADDPAQHSNTSMYTALSTASSILRKIKLDEIASKPATSPPTRAPKM